MNELFAAGKDRGVNIASWVDMPAAGDTIRTECSGRVEVIDVDSLTEAMRDIAYQNEGHNRSYSPFEYIAHAINEREDSEEAWTKYGEGIDAGIQESIEKRVAAVASYWFDGEDA
jgi:predicted RNA-binding protein associated with RNAse of E/G family